MGKNQAGITPYSCVLFKRYSSKNAGLLIRKLNGKNVSKKTVEKWQPKP